MWQTGMVAVLVLGMVAGGQTRPIREATLRDAAGKDVGRVVLRQVTGRIIVELRVRDLPAGAHGYHLHEVGLCEGPSFESAGGHYNPGNKEHGRRTDRGPHLGDLGNITVNENGAGDRSVTITSAEAREGIENFLGAKGRALVVHANEDDERTDPHGNAGARIACAAIMP